MEGIEITVDGRSLLVKEWTVKEMKDILQSIAKAAKEARASKAFIDPAEDYESLLVRVKENVISGIEDYDREKSRFVSKVWTAILQANSGIPLESERSSKGSSLQEESPAQSKAQRS